MKSFLVFFSIAAFLFSGCGKNEKERFEEANQLVKDKKYSEAAAAYDNIVKDYPTSDIAAEALYQNGKLYQSGVITAVESSKAQQKAVEYYQKVFVNYPKAEFAPAALFMAGFIQANTLGNFDEATVTYKKFLSTFPNHELADDVKTELDNMGLSPEEIIAKHQMQITSKK